METANVEKVFIIQLEEGKKQNESTDLGDGRDRAAGSIESGPAEVIAECEGVTKEREAMREEPT